MEATKYLIVYFPLSYAQQILRNPIFNLSEKQLLIKSFLAGYLKYYKLR
jgi:hypothetical protein